MYKLATLLIFCRNVENSGDTKSCKPRDQLIRFHCDTGDCEREQVPF